MRQPQILFALHFLQTRQAALVFKFQARALINFEQRGFRGDDQFDMALVKLIHQRQKTPRLIFRFINHDRHIKQQHAVKAARQFDVIVLAAPFPHTGF